MKLSDQSSPATVVPATEAPATLSGVSTGIAARLRNLAARPHSLTVREVIERYMAVYAGRDGAVMQRHSAWQTILGDFTLEALDADVIHARRNELAALPALTYYGTDHDGKPIFRGKSRHPRKTPATLNRYIAAQVVAALRPFATDAGNRFVLRAIAVPGD